MVTLYFEVLDKRLSRPGTAQNTSLGDPEPRFPESFPLFMPVEKCYSLIRIATANTFIHVLVPTVHCKGNICRCTNVLKLKSVNSAYKDHFSVILPIREASYNFIAHLISIYTIQGLEGIVSLACLWYRLKFNSYFLI